MAIFNSKLLNYQRVYIYITYIIYIYIYVNLWYLNMIRRHIQDT